MTQRISVSSVTINAPAARVWEAITKPELVKQWQFGTDLATDWQPGSPIVYHNEWDGHVYEQKGTVLEIEPGRRVTYSLFAPHPDLAETPENFFTMTYLLEEANGQTTLTITQDDPREQVPQGAAISERAEEENSVLQVLKKLVEG